MYITHTHIRNVRSELLDDGTVKVNKQKLYSEGNDMENKRHNH